MNFRSSVFVLLAFSSLCAHAADEMALARSRNCLACHASDKRVLGPSFKEIGERYAGRPGVEARLAEKILKGGVGVWGVVPMPANPQVSAEEAGRLAAWIATPR